MKCILIGMALTMTTLPTIGYASQLADAVQSEKYDRAVSLLASGANPNDAMQDGDPLLVFAVSSGQFKMARLLIEYDADIWSMNAAGANIASYMYVLYPRFAGTKEGENVRALMEIVRKSGFPPPPLSIPAANELRKGGKWPPPGAKDARGRPLSR